MTKLTKNNPQDTANIADDRVLATVDNKIYQLTNEVIKDGDSVYSEFAKAIDKCIKKFEDGTMCVEFKNGMRAVLSTKYYKKAILQ